MKMKGEEGDNKDRRKGEWDLWKGSLEGGQY